MKEGSAMTNISSTVSDRYFLLTEQYINTYSKFISHDATELKLAKWMKDAELIMMGVHETFRGYPYKASDKKLLATSTDPKKLISYTKGADYWNTTNDFMDGCISITEYLDEACGNEDKPILSEEQANHLIKYGSNPYWRQSIHITKKNAPKLYERLKKLGYTNVDIAIALPIPLPMGLFETAIVEKEDGDNIYLLFNSQIISSAFILEDSKSDLNKMYYQIDEVNSIRRRADQLAFLNHYLRICMNNLKNVEMSLLLKFEDDKIIIEDRGFFKTNYIWNVEVFHKTGRKNDLDESDEFDWHHYYSLNAMDAQKYLFGHFSRKKLREAHRNGELHPFAYIKHPELNEDSEFVQSDKEYRAYAMNIDKSNYYPNILTNALVLVDRNTNKIITEGAEPENYEYISNCEDFSSPDPILEF